MRMSSLCRSVHTKLKSCVLQCSNAKSRQFFTSSRLPQLAVPSSSPDLKIKNIEKLDPQTITVTFSDNNVCSFKNIWLRDSCQCAQCLHPQTKQKLVDIPTLDINLKPSRMTTDSDGEQLRISWAQPDQQEPHDSAYSAEWLHQFIPIFSTKMKKESVTDILYSANLPAISLWDQGFSKLVSSTPYNDFMTSDSGLLSVLSSVHKYGVAVIKGVPTKQGHITEVANRMSYVKETGYGKTFQVKNNPDPKTHLSYTGTKFELHTDLSYRISPPSVQLLHCLVAPDAKTSKRVGGQSFFADGFFAAEWLRKERPDHFQFLSTNKVHFTFQDAERGRWFYVDRPIITLDNLGRLQEFYYSGLSMRPPLLPLEKIHAFYESYKELSSKLYDLSSQWRFYFEPGDLLIFNNIRIAHGRDEYDASKVERHLEGCYMDLEEIFSLYEHILMKNNSNS